MAAEDRILKILLQLREEGASATSAKVVGSLKEVEAQAIKTSAAVKASGSSGGLDAETIAREAAFAERLRKRLELRQAEAAAAAQAQVVLNQNNQQNAQSLEQAGAAGNRLTTIFLGAATAAYVIYQNIANMADEAVRLATETQKQTAELLKQVGHWQEIAAHAGNFADIMKLGGDIGPQLDAMAAKLAEFRQTELTNWQKFADVLTRTFGSAIPGSGPSFNRGNLDRATSTQERTNQIALASANASIDAALKAKEAWEGVQLLPLNEAVEEYTRKLDNLRARQSGIDRSKDVPSFEEWVKVGKEIELAEKRLDQLTKTQGRLSTETDKVVAGIARVDFAQLDDGNKLNALEVNLEEIQDKLHQVGIDAASPNDALEKAKGLAKENAEEVLKLAQAWASVLGQISQVVAQQEEDRRKAAADAVNISLRDQQTLLQRIHQQQQLIGANTFLSPDAKQALTLASMTAELLQLSAAIEQTKQQIAGSALDPELHARLQAQLQKDQFEFDMLHLKIAAINKPLSAELTDWVNSFGTSAHQIANIIESSINASLQATNQLITDAAFRTGDWRQTIVGLEKQLLNFFLTWLEQQALQLAFGEGAKATSTASSVASGAAVAAAHAPAAAATSISSYGTAAVVGEALALAAIIAIMAALGGGFKEGGLTGTNQIARVGEEGPEFVFTNRATRNIGTERLYAMMHMAENAPHFFDGGEVEPGILPGNIGRPPYINPMYQPQPWNSPGYTSPYWSGNNVVGGHLYGPGGGPFDPGGGRYSQFSGGIYYRDSSGQFVQAGAGVTPPSAIGAEAYYRNPSTGLFTRIDPGFPGANPPSITINPGGVFGGAAATAGFVGWDGAGGALYADAHGNIYTRSGTPAPRGTRVASVAPTRGSGARPPTGLLTARQYYQQTFGGLRGVGYRDPRGSAVFDSRASNRLLMDWLAYGGTPNLAQPDSPTRFYHSRMRLDEFGGLEDLGFMSYNLGPGVNTSGNFWSQIPHGADGLRISGSPSRIDTVLAWLAAGEQVIPAHTTAALDQRFGRDWPDRLANMTLAMPRTPHFASGGRASGGGGSSRGMGSSKPMKIVVVANLKEAIREAQNDPDYAATIVNAVNNARHEIGLPAIN